MRRARLSCSTVFEVTADDLADVEPDNIENFSILKDATAAALYESEGGCQRRYRRHHQAGPRG